jgi:hypothetical protein
MASPTDIVEMRKRQLLQQRGAVPATGGAARFVADMENRMARGPLTTSSTTPMNQPVGANSALTGTGAAITYQQSQDRHQVNRQKRVQRLLDRAARKGDIEAAKEAEQFGARMAAEGGPTSQITSAEGGRIMAREKLSQAWQAAQELRRPEGAGATAGGMTAPVINDAVPMTSSTLDPTPPRTAASPGEWGIPPADATSDSGTNGSTSANLREVPESEVATPPTETFDAPPSPTPAFEPPAPAVDDETAARQRAAKAFGGMIFNEGIPFRRNPENNRFEPLPAGAWEEAVERERNFIRMEREVGRLSQNAALQDPEFIARTNARIQAANTGRGPVAPEGRAPVAGATGVALAPGIALPEMPGGLPVASPTIVSAGAPTLQPPLDFQPGPSFAGGALPPSGPQLNDWIASAGRPIGMPGAENFLPARTEGDLTTAWEAAAGLRQIMSEDEAKALSGDPEAYRRVLWLNKLEESRRRNGETPLQRPGLGAPMPAAPATPAPAPSASRTIPGTQIPLAQGQRLLSERLRQPA